MPLALTRRVSAVCELAIALRLLPTLVPGSMLDYITLRGLGTVLLRHQDSLHSDATLSAQALGPRIQGVFAHLQQFRGAATPIHSCCTLAYTCFDARLCCREYGATDP